MDSRQSFVEALGSLWSFSGLENVVGLLGSNAAVYWFFAEGLRKAESEAVIDLTCEHSDRRMYSMGPQRIHLRSDDGFIAITSNFGYVASILEFRLPIIPGSPFVWPSS